MCLAQPAIVARNDDLLFDADIGALAATLASADVERAVIGNADTTQPAGTGGYDRQVGLALADEHGVVPGGEVGQDLLVADGAAPFGVAAARDAYVAAFDRSWTARTVVVVEASDLVRYDAYRPFVSGSARAALQHRLLRNWDELVGAILERVDPARDAVMVVGPTHLGGTARLTMATLRAPDVEPGWLRSAYTRRAGLVSIVDVAPTVLDLFGIERPSEMEGRAYEVVPDDGDLDDRIERLIDVDEAARFRDLMIGTVTTFFAVAEIVLIVVAVFCFMRYRRALHAVEFGALAVLGFLPAAYLARLLPFHDWGWLPFWMFLLGVALALAWLVWSLTSRDGITTLIVILAIVVGVVAVDVATGARLQLNSTLGYSPTVAGRYAGIGNLAYAQLSAGILLLAGLVAARVDGRRGVFIAISLMAFAFVVDGAPFFGADVGGVLSMAPAYALDRDDALGLAGPLAFARVLRPGCARADRLLRCLRRQPPRGRTDPSRPARPHDNRWRMGRLRHRDPTQDHRESQCAVPLDVDRHGADRLDRRAHARLPRARADPTAHRPDPSVARGVGGPRRARGPRVRAQRLRDRGSRDDARRCEPGPHRAGGARRAGALARRAARGGRPP